MVPVGQSFSDAFIGLNNQRAESTSGDRSLAKILNSMGQESPRNLMTTFHLSKIRLVCVTQADEQQRQTGAVDNVGKVYGECEIVAEYLPQRLGLTRAPSQCNA